jgi:hypothetical protein
LASLEQQVSIKKEKKDTEQKKNEEESLFLRESAVKRLVKAPKFERERSITVSSTSDEMVGMVGRLVEQSNESSHIKRKAEEDLLSFRREELAFKRDQLEMERVKAKNEEKRKEMFEQLLLKLVNQ